MPLLLNLDFEGYIPLIPIYCCLPLCSAAIQNSTLSFQKKKKKLRFLPFLLTGFKCRLHDLFSFLSMNVYYILVPCEPFVKLISLNLECKWSNYQNCMAYFSGVKVDKTEVPFKIQINQSINKQSKQEQVVPLGTSLHFLVADLS